MIEMTIPSSLDKTIAPPGKHVVQVCERVCMLHRLFLACTQAHVDTNTHRQLKQGV